MKAEEYKFQDIMDLADNSRWNEIKKILLKHPNPIVRHEASFWIGRKQNNDLIPTLLEAIKNEKSIVAKHEAIEALDFVEDEPYLSEVYNF